MGTVWETLKEKVLAGWEVIQQWWAIGTENFKTNWTRVGDAISQIVENIKQGIINLWEKLTSIFENVKTTFTNIITTLKNLWNDFCTSLKDTIDKAWDKVVKTFSKGGGGFQAITEGISSTLKGYINKLISGINSIIYTPFSRIQSMMNTLRNFSIAGITPFRGLPWISIPQIPMLAKGGFPEDGLFFANSGELVGKFANGNTAVANNEQIIEGIKRGVIDAMTQVNSRNNDSTPDVTVNIDGYELARIISKNQRYLERVEGRAL